MNETCTHGHCWWSYLICLAWLLVSSGLLMLTWNKVVAAMIKVKSAKYWQALLLVATLSVFCAPRYFMHCGHAKGCSHSCSHKGGDCDSKKEDCPYASKHHGQSAEEKEDKE
jgi:hypothetical protein